MTNEKFPNRFVVLRPKPLLAFLLLAAASPLIAADKTWDGEGANDSWQTGANWDPTGGGGTAPVPNDSLFFDGNTRTTPANNFPAGTIFQSLTFNAGADLFTLSGNSIVITNPPGAVYTGGLNAPYVGGSITNLSPNAETIGLPLTLANGHHHIVVNPGAGQLNLASPVTLGNAASATFSIGVNLTGSGLANQNGILGGWATMNPPNHWATLDGGGNVVEYAGYTDVSAGSPISSGAANNIRIPDSGANVTLAGGPGVIDINTLHFGQGATANQIVEVATNQILRFGAKGGIFNASRQITGTSRVLTIGTNTTVGPVTAGGADNTPGDLYLIETPFIGNTGNQLVMNSRITNNGTAPVTVHMFGHISFPGGAHTYSGGTYIHGGRLSATGPNTLGTGPVYVYPGGQLFLNAAGTYTNAVFIAGLGNAESVGNGAIRMGGRSISGTVTLMEDAATANGTLSGRITGPGGLIVGAGSGNGVGTLTIGSTAGANDYSGNTVINASNATATSTLTIASGRYNIMPHGAGKGNVVLYGASVLATFNLNGTSQIINGLTSIGASANCILNSSPGGNVTLTVGDGDANGSFGGVIQNGSGIALTKIGTGQQTLSGVNTYTNATTVSGGKLAIGVGGSIATTSQINVNSNATFDVSDASPFTLTGTQSLAMSNGTVVVALQPGGNAVTTPILQVLGSTNFVSVTAIPAISTYPAQFVAIKYAALGGALNFTLGGSFPPSPGTPYGGFVSNNVANGSVDVVITSGPTSIKWQGYGGGSPNSIWDTGTFNWVTFGGSPTTYGDGNFVRFDNSASNGVVTLSQNVSPAGITISNTSLAYTIGDGGAGYKISGLGGITKQGSGTAILDNAGANDFGGDVTIASGTLQLGNGGGSGNLPADATVIDNGTLAIARSDTFTFPNIISGSGGVTYNGVGTLNLSAANTFAGVVNVLQGTLQTTANTALGATNGGTVVASGATLDVTANAINLGQEVITISGVGVGGGGALINSAALAAFVGPNVARVIMSGNATVGGSGRFDLRSNPTSNPLAGSLSTGGLPRKLTKVGSGTFGLIGITVDPALGDIDVQQGIFSLEAAVTSAGNVLSNLTVFPGATLQMFAVTNMVNKIITLGGDGAITTVSATSGGANTIIGPMAITNDCIFSVNNNVVSLTLSNVITGPGKITKIGAGSLTIAGNSPNYGGGLLLSAGNATISGTISNALGIDVSSGKFALNGTLLGTAGITNLAVMAGSGTTAGPIDVTGTLFPGDTNVVGTLTSGQFIAEGSCTIGFDLGFDTTVGSGSNDLIQINGDLVVNGGTIVINPLGILKNGQSYRLFNYTGALIWNGNFTVPDVIGYTFTLDTNTPGQVKLVSSGGPPVWNGGSPTVNNWSDAANWANVPIQPGNSLYFSGSTRLNNTNDTSVDTSYQDIAFVSGAGAFTLNGNYLSLNGNIINSSTSTQTVNIAMNLSGSRSFNGNSGVLRLMNGLTNTANNNLLTFGGTGVVVNLMTTLSGNETNVLAMGTTNASWTLIDNPTSGTITNPVQLDIEAGTFTIGSATSAPKLFSSTLSNSRIGVSNVWPATLNMVNGQLTISARLNTGVAGNSIATINQSGGTISVYDVFQGADGAVTAISTLNVSGGLFDCADPGGLNNFFLASRGTGIVNLANSGVINCATLDMSRNAAGTTAGSVGVINLNGGILAASRLGTATSAAQNGGAPTATLKFNGGTLKANASSATWVQGNASAPAIPIATIVSTNGGTIDTTNFNVSILEPMIHDPTLGVNLDGGLIKKGTGTLTIPTVNTYTGPTTVSNGTFLLNGTLAGSAVTVAGGTFTGSGNVGKNLDVLSGGTVSPGAGIGILNITNGVSLTGVTLMEINPALGTNDLLRSITGNISYAGNLTVTNIGGLLANGQSFKLFHAGGGTYAGGFSTVTLPGLSAGQSWNLSQLNVSGTISVVGNPSPPVISSVSPVGGNLVISGGGGVTNGSFQMLTSTNIGLPLTNWTLLGTGQFDGNGNFSTFVAIDPATPRRFFAIRMP